MIKSMIEQNDFIITGTLAYGRLLNKLQKSIFISAIIIGLILILFSFLSLFFLGLWDGIIFIVCSTVMGSILIVASYLELNYDKKNNDLINHSISDMIISEATLEVIKKDWNRSKKIRILFSYNRKKIVLYSNKYIKLKNDVEGKIKILYSQNMNSVMFFTYK